MPELPEVEIVKEGLKSIISSQDVIQSVEFFRKDLRSALPNRKTSRSLIGRSIQNFTRRAKYILMQTEKDVILSHLGMTGQWRTDGKTEKHDHIEIRFESGLILTYNDPRRFGVFDIISHNNLETDKRLAHLGPEPLDPHAFSGDYLFEKTRKKEIPIKSLIMDQKIVVGVGNIYASEALFLASIRPLARSKKITKNQANELVLQIRNVLKTAIHSGGSSIRDYVDPQGKKGNFQESHAVYGRAGQACLKCGEKVRSQVLSGRSTFWCVNCQK